MDSQATIPFSRGTSRGDKQTTRTNRRRTSKSTIARTPATSGAAKPRPVTTISRLTPDGHRRLNQLKQFLMVRTADLKLSDEQFTQRVAEFFEFETDALVRYLNTGMTSQPHVEAFRRKIVELWAPLKKYEGQQVDWKFVATQIGIAGVNADLRVL